jgi:hypothetical protein
MENATAGQGAIMGFGITGATTLTADANRAIRSTSAVGGDRYHMSRAIYQTGLTAGTNVFTAKYAVPASGTGGFAARDIFVFPF